MKRLIDSTTIIKFFKSLGIGQVKLPSRYDHFATKPGNLNSNPGTNKMKITNFSKLFSELYMCVMAYTQPLRMNE